jgi:hypothetical protein
MSDNIQYPSVPEMGTNLAKFAFDLLKKSMKGDALLVSEEIAQERMNICKTCEYYDPEKNRCKHCGCFLEHKVKWSLDGCPIEKWTASDKDWIEGGKFEELYNHVKLGTEPKSPYMLDHGEIPDFPDAETTPVGFVYVYKGTQWQFTGETWVPYSEDSEFDQKVKESIEHKTSNNLSMNNDQGSSDS